MRFTFRLNGRLTSALKNQIKANLKQADDAVNDLKVKVGLEIHARILSKTKIFSKTFLFSNQTWHFTKCHEN